MSWLFALLGALVLAAGFGITLLGKRLPRSWQTTQGVITSSEGWEAQLNSGNVPVARVKFRYQVDNQEYEGQQRWAHGPLPPKSGALVTVYYDPLKPKKSSVAPFATSNDLVGLAYFLVFAGIALFAVALFKTLSG